MPEVSVVVPALNAAATLRQTLEALTDQDLDVAFEVIVVDDGSDDGTGDLAWRASPLVRVIRQSRGGPASARNRGARAASGRILAFTDADCVPQRSWLREGVAALGEADLVQGRVVPDPLVEPEPFDRTISVNSEYGLYQTANLFVTAELFDTMGGFEDWLPARVGKPLAEDVWFGWRARRNGARTAFCARAVVHHAVFRRRVYAYIAERARLIYFPAMVAKMPELRQTFLYRRWFLNRRTARFDLALIAAAVAIRAPRGSAIPYRFASLAAAAPYLRTLLREALPWGRRGLIVLMADFLADVVGFGALAWGTVRRRNAVL